jgi:hypothetical protein
VLQASGSILYQYKRMASSTLNSATIGVENFGGSIALQVLYNQSYVHDGLAILITNDILPWASVFPTFGTLGPGDSTNVELRIHPAGLVAGRLYNGKMRVLGNTTDAQLIRITLSTTTTSVETERGIPVSFALGQNYPNPFNPVTTITYALPKSVHVQLSIYDVLGREVTTLVNGMEEAGFKSVRFDGSRCASGFYFYRIQAGDFVQTRKLLLIK